MKEEHRGDVRKSVGLSTVDWAGAGERTVRARSASARVDQSAVPAGAVPTAAADEQAAPLFSYDEATEFRVLWDSIQEGFADEPRRAVEQADGLVAGAMKRLAEIFAEQRAELDGQWDRKERVSTENLRLAWHRYRSFFDRFLSV